jgi:hypothetical protein
MASAGRKKKKKIHPNLSCFNDRNKQVEKLTKDSHRLATAILHSYPPSGTSYISPRIMRDMQRILLGGAWWTQLVIMEQRNRLNGFKVFEL